MNTIFIIDLAIGVTFACILSAIFCLSTYELSKSFKKFLKMYIVLLTLMLIVFIVLKFYLALSLVWYNRL